MNETPKPKLKVGQKLALVWSERYRGDPCEVTVVKIGRKWASLDNKQRIDLETWRVDGHGHFSPGQCFESIAQYEAMLSDRELWGSFKREVGDTYYQKFRGTADDIRKAAELLGLTLK